MMQFRHILVPTDFSPPSRLALSHGIGMARRFHSRLTLLHVVEPSGTLAYTFPGETAKVEGDYVESIGKMLPALAPDDPDIDFQSLVRFGGVEEQIRATVDEETVDLIVMGTHGRGLIRRLFIGSVTLGVLTDTEVPILTVRHTHSYRGIDRILLATDLSGVSQKASRLAIEFAKTSHSKLIALHSVDADKAAEAPALREASRFAKARAGMDEFKAEAARQDVPIETVLERGAPSEIILHTADRKHADMIVIAVSRNAEIQQTLLGSTAERVIREAHVPVMSVPTGSDGLRKRMRESEAA